jgi:FdrA protein
MPLGSRILKNQYFDSVFLMRVNKRLSDEPGVQNSAVLMGSEGNKKLLADLGLYTAVVEDARANDLIVVLLADNEELCEQILARLPEFLEGGGGKEVERKYRTLEEGIRIMPNANLAVISIPGEFAAREGRKALEKGLHVFLFSDNVTIDDEKALKEYASSQGLMVMGPDCGTSLIGGVGIGFANAVRKGSIGAVGPAGTGLQEFTCQVHNAGFGISHAIGTGSHDLTDEIGGITTMVGLEALDRDPDTQVIAIISKPPGKRTLGVVRERIKSCHKPVVACFLGTQPLLSEPLDSFEQYRTIDATVVASIMKSGGRLSPEPNNVGDEKRLFERETAGFSSQQKYLRGLFAGGTFCYQTQDLFKRKDMVLFSNAPLDREQRIEHPNQSVGNCVIDMGDDYFTQGKPHPMIDGTERAKRILQEAHDPEMKVLLLDFILGFNSSMDPVGELAEAIRDARQIVQHRGGRLSVVASICGTEDDIQEIKLQKKILEELEVVVFSTNARAAEFCLDLIRQA